MKDTISELSEIFTCNIEGNTRVDTMQATDTRRYQLCPPPASASKIKPFCILRQNMPGENRKVAFKTRLVLLLRKFGLVKAYPFITKSFYCFAVNVCFFYSYVYLKIRSFEV